MQEGNVFAKIENSFKKAMAGQESVNVVIYWWGALGYLVSYLLIERMIKAIDITFVDILLSIIPMIYFSWHIYVLKKCSPKKPQLTKEEKAIIRAEKRKVFWKSFLRKLLLQEPITRFDATFTTIVIDVFSIACFSTYLF